MNKIEQESKNFGIKLADNSNITDERLRLELDKAEEGNLDRELVYMWFVHTSLNKKTS